MAILEIDKLSIRKNVLWFLDLAKKKDVELTVVTKFCGSEPVLMKALTDGGIRSIADSNMQNFQKPGVAEKAFPEGGVRKSLIKTRLSDIRKIPSLTPMVRPDRIFTSDPMILRELRTLSPPMCPEVVLIIEIGDLKEGLYPRDISGILREFGDLPIIGVSANFACMSGKMPDRDSLEVLQALAEDIQRERQLPAPFLSLGGTVILPLLEKGLFGCSISEIRIGEGLFFGYDSSGGRDLPGLSQQAFTLRGEIIEIKEKEIELPLHSVYNALGESGTSRKTGKRTCAVLDFGILGGQSSQLFLLDADADIAGQTYDYTVVDITDSSCAYATGDYISFLVYYSGASQAFLNNYVTKILR